MDPKPLPKEKFARTSLVIKDTTKTDQFSEKCFLEDEIIAAFSKLSLPADTIKAQASCQQTETFSYNGFVKIA
jgi:hypothetical protein